MKIIRVMKLGPRLRGPCVALVKIKLLLIYLLPIRMKKMNKRKSRKIKKKPKNRKMKNKKMKCKMKNKQMKVKKKWKAMMNRKKNTQLGVERK
jgi:hypothetical protein